MSTEPPSIIGAPTGGGTDKRLPTTSSAPALTTITTTQEFNEYYATGATGSTETSVFTKVITSTITNASQYAAIAASESTSQSRASTETSQTGSTSDAPFDPSWDVEGKSSDTGAMAGGVVGALLCLVLIAIAVFWKFRRHRTRKSTQEAYSKPELDSKDIKPDCKELAGSEAPTYMLQRYAQAVELPAHEILPEKDSVPCRSA